MKLTMRAKALGKQLTLITTAFVLAVSSLTAITPFILSEKASAATTVNSQAELVKAMGDGETVINLGSSFSTNSQINIDRTLTLNGNGYTISPVFNGSSNNDTAIAVVKGSPVISNLTIEGVGATNVQGIQVWQAAATLSGITSRNNDKAGIHINGSTVTINNVVTAANGTNFGGILVSGGTVTINGQSQHTENTNWTGNKMDLYRTDGAVVDTNDQYALKLDIFGRRIYTLKAAPAAPSITLPAQGTRVTNGTGEVTFKWTAVTYASTYDISIDGGAWVNVSGTSYTTTLPEGNNHTVSVRAVAKSGLAGAVSALRNFQVGIPPVFTISNLENNQRVGVAASKALNVRGTFTDTSGGYVELQLVKDGVGSVGLVSTHAPVVDGTLATFNTEGLKEGTYTLYARPTDYLGNALPQQSIALYLDPSAPAAPTNLAWTNSNSAAVSDGAFTNVYEGSASWKANSEADIDHYIYRSWNEIAGSNYNSKDSAWPSVTTGTSLPGAFNQGNGTYHFTVTAVDRAGNQSEESAPFTVRYDGAGPTYSVSNLSNGQIVGTVSDGKLTVLGSFNDNEGGSGANYIQVQLVKDGLSRGVSTVHGAVNNGVIAQFDVTGFESGTYQVNVLGAADGIGNWAAGPGLSLTIEIDNERPVATIEGARYLTTDEVQSVSGTASADSAVTLYVDGVEEASDIVPDATGNWTYVFATPRPAGTYVLSVVATDKGGNQSDSEQPSAVANFVVAEPVVVVAPSEQNPAPAGPEGDNGDNDNSSADNTAPNGGLPFANFGAAGVLGLSDDADDSDNGSTGAADVEGVSTIDNLAQAVDADNTDGKALGLAWYWWLLIVAAVAALVWWIVAAIRNRQAAE